MPRAAFFTSFVFREVGHFQAFPLIFQIAAASKSKSFCREYVAVVLFFFLFSDWFCLHLYHRSESQIFSILVKLKLFYTIHHLPSARHLCSTCSTACRPPLPLPPIPDLVEHIAVLQEAALGERCARSPSYVQIKHIWSDDIHFLFVW